jgi:CRISPR-associated endoribonuclease Cas6
MLARITEQNSALVTQESKASQKEGPLQDTAAVLGSLRVAVTSLQESSLPGNGGQALHGLFISIMARRSQGRVALLHRAAGLKPFSISPLEGCRQHNGRSLLPQNGCASFRVCILETDLLGETIAAFYEAKRENRHLALGKAVIIISEVEVERNKDAAFTSFADLLAGSREEKQIGLEFLSPTTFKFKVKGGFLHLPLPELVFSSLVRHWEASSPVSLPPGVRDCLSSIRISRYELRTELLAYARFKSIGFTGRVTYDLDQSLPPTLVRAINCLADFAWYSGVGWKTTMGMGQTRRTDCAGSLPDRTGSYPQKRRGASDSNQG